MKRIEYKTVINAPRDRVWESLWGQDTYPQWTRSFSPQSKVETTWEVGGKVLFLNGNNGGMISKIMEKNPPEKMIFEHLGMIDKDGKEDLKSPAVKAWKGAKEIYILEERDGKTELTVQMDMDEAHEDYMNNAWPKAFKDLKEISEI